MSEPAEKGLAEKGLAEKGLAEKGLAGLVGQDAAVRALRAAAARPVHAYLFVGPPGTGKLTAAMAFAAMLLCPGAGEDGCETCRRVIEGVHPDVVVIEREGPALTIEQAREVSRVAARSSLEGGRSVVVLPDLHLAREAVPALLKTIEEPPGNTVFISLAEFVPAELETIASRSARIDFRPLSEGEVTEVLLGEGVAPERASVLARLSGGRLDRARLLASDGEGEARWRSWEAVPARLDGTGATVALLAEELVESVKRSAGPLSRRQQTEAAELTERYAREVRGAPGRAGQSAARAAARELEERHRREQRRQRTDELRTGLAALAGAYRDRAATGALPPATAAGAVGLIDGLSADLAFNPGEVLAVQALLLRLDRLGGA
ncbi:MAG TPA: ATP-binding protein [Acidimicrobiales bacterium]|nr:ATP-binding protein [Acidimicrobiales bacterium]